jgi:hypothetical protein
VFVNQQFSVSCPWVKKTAVPIQRSPTDPSRKRLPSIAMRPRSFGGVCNWRRLMALPPSPNSSDDQRLAHAALCRRTSKTLQSRWQPPCKYLSDKRLQVSGNYFPHTQNGSRTDAAYGHAATPQKLLSFLRFLPAVQTKRREGSRAQTAPGRGPSRTIPAERRFGAADRRAGGGKSAKTFAQIVCRPHFFHRILLTIQVHF